MPKISLNNVIYRFLKGEHGKIPFIENEYGELDIDHGLAINLDEEVFEMSNTSICCTVHEN